MERRVFGGLCILLAGTISSEAWNHTAAELDVKGRFVLQDVTPGAHRLYVRGNRRVQQRCVQVAPGEKLAGILLVPTVGGAGAGEGENAKPVIESNLVVPAEGAGLRVQVSKAGRADPSAVVRLEPADWHYYFSPGWAARRRDEPSKAFRLILNPTQAVDEDGAARFRNLVPGNYNVYAVSGGADGGVPHRAPYGRVA